MDAAFTAEQDAIRRTLHELLDATAPGEHRRELWCRLTEGLERAPLAPPLLTTDVLAAPLLAALGTEEQRATLLPDLVAGHSSAALAVSGAALSVALGLTGDNADGGWAGGGRSGGVQARRGEKGWVLYGQAEQVLDGHSADLLLVAAHTGGFARGRVLLFLVRAKEAVGLARVRQTAAEEARPQATLQLRYVDGELLGSGEGVAEALGTVGRTAAVVLAAEAVGVAERLLAPAADRAGGRVRLAEAYAAVEAARSAAYRTVWHPADASGGVLALAQGLEALRTAATEVMRVGGGDGAREARDCFARAAADEVLFGPVERLRARAVEVSGAFGRTEAGAAGREAV
ncbi:acyl-CoA dehydrogenase [Streptomyces spiroverticillatus]|uniref:Acyl-CoA dehydrogenase n=1 Tax=Streptomyces finlayi TaxID=67296 RepID=A0A918X172_9ACTN|nr:acyl-CoA dehydrogenase [Streptomyces finlayi]GHA20125.1 acyl-CoA dehydrogenase [Streptomyces spiroverticillatus]GHD02941.1 acyl-CoA dehydrogenase [Streptomyces finlayi]